MRHFPEGGQLDTTFGAPVDKPTGPRRYAPHGMQGAGLNAITDVRGFFAPPEATPEPIVTDDVIAAFMEDPLWYRKLEAEPEPVLAEAPTLLTGTDALIADWVEDPNWAADPDRETLTMSQEEADELFVPGVYEVVPHGLRRLRDRDEDIYEAAHFRRSRHRRSVGERVMAGMVEAPVVSTKTFLDSAEAA